MRGTREIMAVVPAAGLSRRFRASSPDDAAATYKQLALIGGKPMLAVVLDMLETSRIACAIVVTHPAITAEIARVRPSGPRREYVENPRENCEMLESVQMGLRRVLTTTAGLRAEACRGVLICPADHPGVTTVVIDLCIDTFLAQPDRIVVAAYRGRRGHPLIVPRDLAYRVMTWPAQRRLSELRMMYPDRFLAVETHEPGVLRDVDTVGDLAGDPPN